MIQPIPLGSRGLEYVFGELQAGHSLAKCLVDQRPAFRQAYTLLPPGLSTESLTDFDSGGKLSGGRPESGESLVRIPNTDSELVDRIRRHLEVSESNAC